MVDTNCNSYNNIPHLRTQLFNNVMAEAAKAPVEYQTHNLEDYIHYCSESLPCLLFFSAISVIIIILIVRPPFALYHEQDIKRPWKSSTRISVIASLLCIMIILIIITGLPLLISKVSSKTNI